MKRSIFMYLFFFAILFIIFQYMNEKTIFESQEKKITSLTKKLTTANDSLHNISENVLDLNYFTLLGNDNAMSYIESLGFEATVVQQMVTDAIYDKNTAVGGNPLIPVDGMQGTMRINKIKFLNHRWVVADFTNGTYWGELVIEYFFTEKNELELTTIASVLYPLN